MKKIFAVVLAIAIMATALSALTTVSAATGMTITSSTAENTYYKITKNANKTEYYFNLFTLKANNENFPFTENYIVTLSFDYYFTNDINIKDSESGLDFDEGIDVITSAIDINGSYYKHYEYTGALPTIQKTKFSPRVCIEDEVFTEDFYIWNVSLTCTATDRTQTDSGYYTLTNQIASKSVGIKCSIAEIEAENVPTEAPPLQPSTSLYLEGEIGLNIYIPYRADVQSGYIKLIYNHNTTGYTKEVKSDIISFADCTPINDNYIFTIYFSAPQICEGVSFRVYSKDAKTLYEVENYSIATYCNTVIASGVYDDSLINLCKAILNYGACSQKALNYDYDEDVLAVDTGFNNLTITSDTLAKYKVRALQTPPSQLDPYAISFVSTSKSGLRLYFDNSIEELNRCTITCSTETDCNGEKYYNIASPSISKCEKNGGCYIEIGDIISTNLNYVYALTISYTNKENTETTEFTIRLCPLGYCYNVLCDGSDTDLTNACKAIYQYSLAADTYFNS